MCVPTDFDVEIPSCNLPRVKGQAMGLDERNNSEAFVIFFFLVVVLFEDSYIFKTYTQIKEK